ncbi:MAG: fatty acid desaturase [Bdellovibrionota bacterium]
MTDRTLQNEAALTPRRKIIWHNVLFLILNPIAALILTPIYLVNNGISWGLVLFLVITYTISNMSITSGYHRYFSHRTFNLPLWMENIYVVVAAGAFQGSLLQWCADHRRHHREVDGDADPYSRSKGFLFAHITWMFRRDPHPESRIYPKDLAKNPLIVWQHKYYPLIATFVGYVIPGLVGYACGFGFWGGAIIGGSLRIFLSQHSTFLINSAAHTFGKRPYTDTNSARDNHFLSFLTFGEGYHNFHHFFQADFRNGIRWYQWDPTKWWIQSLAFLGIATKLKKARKEEIFKARINMEGRELLSIGAPVDRVEQVKLKLLAAQARMREMREEIRTAKAAFRQKRREMSEEMRRQMHVQLLKLKIKRRAEIKVAKLDFKVAYSEWRMFRRILTQAKAA